MKKGLLGLSLMTLSCLYGVLIAFILLVCIICGVTLSNALFIAIIALVIQFLISPFLTDLTMKWCYKAQFGFNLPEHLNQYINEMCKQNNMNAPKIGFIDDGAPNAFTYGRTKNDARIVITRGVLELLSAEEAKTVIAHEMGHIVHHDMIFMTAAQLVPLILYYIYDIFTSAAKDKDNDKNSYFVLVGYLAYILYVISQYVILWLSRTREYYADSFSVETTKNPNALAQALVKIGYGLTAATTKKGKMSVSKSNALGIFDAKSSKSLVITSNVDGKVSQESIKNAMKWEKWNKWAKWYELNSTHPLISNRILKISERSPEFNQTPFIVFDLQPEENYNQHFIRELMVLLSPWVIIILLALLLVFDILPLIRVVLAPLFAISLLVRFNRAHINKGYQNYKIKDLLSIVKVSGVTSVPCIVEGTVIGRGTPGYIFDEDFVIKDETGFVFIDYNHVFQISNFFTGLLKTKKLFGKKVRIKGWYRRSPVPYIEVYEIQVEDGKLKRLHSYGVGKVMLIIFTILSAFLGLFLVL